MTNFLDRKYVLEKSDNFDQYMKELGVGMTLRKMGNTVIPTCELKKNGKIYTFTIETAYQKCSIHFELNKKFNEITPDNRKVTTVCTMDNNMFVQEQKADGLKSTKTIREYKDGELITTLNVGNVKAVRNYILLRETGKAK